MEGGRGACVLIPSTYFTKVRTNVKYCWDRCPSRAAPPTFTLRAKIPLHDRGPAHEINQSKRRALQLQHLRGTHADCSGDDVRNMRWTHLACCVAYFSLRTIGPCVSISRKDHWIGIYYLLESPTLQQSCSGFKVRTNNQSEETEEKERCARVL